MRIKATAKNYYIIRLTLLLCFFMIQVTGAVAQFSSTWMLTSDKTVTVSGTQMANVTAGNMIPGSDFPNPGSHNTDGYQCAQTLGNWPVVPTDGQHIDFPLSPSGNVDLNLTGITLTAKTSGGSGNNLISLAYQKNGVGAWVPFATAQTANSGGTTNINFGIFSQKFYSNNNYIIRMYVYAAGSGTTTSRTVRVKNVIINGNAVSPAGTPPTVATNTATATGRYTATASGTLTTGTLSINQSGICWSTVPNPTIASTTLTTNGPLVSGVINASLTGLSALTTYYIRAYATAESGVTYYGSELTITTFPPIVPVLTTTSPITNILSNRATAGGNISDSGGVAVSTRGVCWSTTTNPTITNSRTINGSGIGLFTSQLTGLFPSTTYYVRAYAINNVGVAYGNEVQFITAAPTPIIEATPINLDFGNVVVNTSSPNISYSLKASVLSPASGAIVVTAPIGFSISLSPSSGFTNVLNVPYTGGSLAATTIYVRFLPTQFGIYSGTITHSGGGAIPINVQNVSLSGFGIQSTADISNTGTDFWVGYGYQALMTSSNNQDMVMYISSKQDAVVTVEIPGIGYTQTYNVTANTALSTNPIPKFTGQDARLFSTGIMDKGIHVYSNGIPISLWAHIYAASSSGATMVLPTPTWGSDYTVLTTGGQTNSGIPHSFFFVMAADDNTVVNITPSADITSAVQGTTILYPAGVPFSVTLNKGQVFNALGKLISSSVGVDLTGTKVKSQNCKKIALFTGNGRVQLSVGGCSYTNGGSDNFIQQMFPKAAWGSKYLTIPFKDMEAGFYRVVVNDPSTQVRINGTLLPSINLINGFYYQIETAEPNSIESDKPVMVAQFCASNKCNGTGLAAYPNTGDYGDPEMVILSPVKQAIEDVTVYSSLNYGIQRNYINAVVKNSGVSSFKLDAVNVSAQFVTHPKDTAYSYAQFNNLAGGVPHRLTSAIPFNATAYGFSTSSTNESYGYNAGTYLRDLNTKLFLQNPYGISENATTCKSNNVKFRIAIPNPPSSINSLTWDFNNNPNISPNIQQVQNNPLSDSTFLIDGTTLYVYTLNIFYNFNTAGTYPIKVLLNGTTLDGCVGTKEYSFDVLVTDGIIANFNAATVCVGDTTKFFDASNPQGSTIVKWAWTFHDGTIDSLQNVKKKYTAAGNYNVLLRAINNIGCYDDTTQQIKVAALPIASFTSNTTGCVNTPVTFTNSSTCNDGTITNWQWNFGAGVVNQNNGNPQTYTFSTPGTYPTTLQVTSSLGCISNPIFSKPITIYKTTAAFTASTPGCLNTPLLITENSNGGGSLINTWQWNFGNGNTSNQQNPNNIFYTISGSYTISLTATSAAGCIGNTTQNISILPALATPIISVIDSSFNSVTFSWTQVAGATAYQVSVNGGSYITPSSGATGLIHKAVGLQPNQIITIQVKVLGSLLCQQTIGSAVGHTSLPDIEIFVPNTFTPNGDGKNDYFKIFGNYISTSNMQIYNQWGEMIFTTNDLNGWDGNAKGKAQPVGVYIYVITVTKQDGTIVNKKGSVNLVR